MKKQNTHRCSSNVSEALSLVLAKRSDLTSPRRPLNDKFGENTHLAASRFSDDELKLLAHVYEQIDEDTLLFFNRIVDTDRLPTTIVEGLFSAALAERVRFRLFDEIDESFQALLEAQGGFRKHRNLADKVEALECEASIGLLLLLDSTHAAYSRPKKALTERTA